MPKEQYPPMSRGEAREMARRRKGDVDVRRLLQEVARLRAHVRYSRYILDLWLRRRSPAAQSCAESHLRVLDKEPFVLEDDEDARARAHIPGTAYYARRDLEGGADA